jgi:hypothetical protein
LSNGTATERLPGHPQEVIGAHGLGVVEVLVGAEMGDEPRIRSGQGIAIDDEQAGTSAFASDHLASKAAVVEV